MAELADTIENEPVVKKKSLAGGAVGDTRLVEYANGKKVVRKEAINQFGQNTPQMQADAEQLSSLVLRALGLRAPRVYRSDRDGAKVIHMEYVDKAKAPSPWRDTLQDTDEGRVMALADTLIINGDRHHGNWFIKDGHIVPIDNGLAFDEKYFHAIRAGWHVPRGHFSKSDIAEVRARLEKLKPDFELVGRADWHQKMMQRLDRQEHRASASGPSRLLPVLH